MSDKALAYVRESPFCNTYGGLSLVADERGQLYLVMGDCMGDSYFGPLTEEQRMAFDALCEVTVLP